ncbi:MAG: DnaB-like helicase N-terminal domain-containing protein, partial [Flavobacteriales bacterium]
MEKTNTVAGKKIDKARIISLEKGKIPPQAVELEEAVLGAMMIDKKGIDDVIDVLSADAFYDQKHQEIYAAIYQLFQNSEP